MSEENEYTTTTITFGNSRIVTFLEPLIDGYKLAEHPRRVGIEAAIRYLKSKERK